MKGTCRSKTFDIPEQQGSYEGLTARLELFQIISRCMFLKTLITQA